MKKAGKITKETIIYIFLTLWALLNLFPIYWMFTFSLKSNSEIFGENIIGLPNEWLWSNYSKAIKVGNIFRCFFNSAFIAVITIVLVMIVALMATFAITRFM